MAKDRAFLEGALEALWVYADGAIVLCFKEDGLFGPSKPTSSTTGVRLVGDAELPAKRAESEDLVRSTQECALPTDRFKIIEANGLTGIRSSASKVLSENSVSVPSGIRTRVAGVKGRYPGPLDDGD